MGKLRDELLNDPLGRGYAGMTDAQALSSLTETIDRDVVRSVITGSTIFNAIVPSEFAGLSADQKQLVRDVFSLGDAVDVGPGTNARTVLLDAFTAGTTTRQNLIDAVSFTVSRAEELGLGNINELDVKRARE